MQNANIRAIVITGAGDKAFCAGADLKERKGISDNDVRKQVELYRSELGPLDRSPKPVVAAINGVAFGGGLELALMCDLRVGASHCKLGLPETSLGIIPGAGGTQRLPRVVGEARAKEMILLARPIDAETALAWGLLNRITDVGKNVVDDAIEWLAPIANGAPIAQASALEAIDRSFDVSLETGLELEKVSYDKVLVSERSPRSARRVRGGSESRSFADDEDAECFLAFCARASLAQQHRRARTTREQTTPRATS